MHQMTLMAFPDHCIRKFLERKWKAGMVRGVSVLHW